MQMGVNRVFIMGYVGSQPELGRTKTDRPITTLSVGVSEYIKGESRTTWARVTFIGVSAEAVCKWVTKGCRVYVEGRLSVRKYETPDGKKHRNVGVFGQKIIFLTRKDDVKGEQPLEVEADESDIPFGESGEPNDP